MADETIGQTGGAGQERATAGPIRTSRWLIAMALVSLVLAIVATRYVAAIEAVDEWTRDFRIAVFTPPEAQDENVVIVSITEDVLDQYPYRMPVDRALLADVVKKLDNAGARAIGIDFLLDKWTEPEKDRALIQAIEEAQTVVMPIWANEEVGTTEERRKILQQFIGERPTGFGMVLRGRFDGTVRFFQPVWSETGDVRWQFSAAMARALEVDVPAKRNMRIDWHGRPEGEDVIPPFIQYRADDALVLPDEWFKDKVVLVGPVLADIDYHRTPFSAAYWQDEISSELPGVVIHAHILSQLLEGRTLGMFTLIEEILLVGLMIGLGLLISFTRWPLWAKLFVGLTLVGAVPIGAVLWFYYGGPMMPIMSPVLGFVLVAAAATVYLGRQEREQRALIRHAFTKYVPPSVVARLDKDPSRLVLGGERRMITLLFTDLQGFTTLSEGLNPAQLGEIITGYLDGVGNIILSEGGTIDKFLGDGSMSFFGAPESTPEDADKAVFCALRIQAFSKTFQETWKARGIDIGRTRIGVHTGTAIVGNFGGHDRFDYTALGDAVNTGSRLEAANKVTGTNILVSAATVEATTRIRYRPVGDLILPGKNQPIATFEPVGSEPDDMDADTDKWLRAYDAAFERMKRRDPDSASMFQTLAERYPDDVLVAWHQARLKEGETGATISIVLK